MASCSSRIYAPQHSLVLGLASINRSRAGILSKRHLSGCSDLIEVRIGSTDSLQKAHLREKKKNKGPSYRNVQTNGRELQTDDIEKPKIAILLEVEGVIADVGFSGNYHAFNVAFQKLGLNYASWTRPVYMNLLRKAGGDDKRMLFLFFDRIGWPTSYPTNEKESFLKNLLREKRCALEDYVRSSSLSLRPGIEKFMDDAFEEQIPVIILSAYSRNGEETASYIVEKLGSERISKTRIVGQAEVDKSFYGQLILGKGISAGTDELLAKEVAKAVAGEKQRVAEEVASMLNLSVEIDTTPDEMLKKIIASLRAGAEYTDIPLQNCILLSGCQAGVCAAQRIGMPCIVIRSSSTSRAEFPSARAVVEGFGYGELTVSKICRMAK
ncbi:CBBY-like protein isoform X2 [Cryptomeria japonica]|uniref:CBBY-like protein isoform X2 n=1 Tax=Cryptomeria japonica TaxID=3369 RepID=UPI0027DA4B0A|nr:CBBY-like protein isoform X2 [Cryptomeria japonica]